MKFDCVRSQRLGVAPGHHAQPARPAQRAQRPGGDRRGRRSRRWRHGDRQGAGRLQGRRPPLPALRRGSGREERRPLHADRRLRPPPGGDGGDAGRRARRLSRPPPGAGLPAAPLHAHARLLRGFRQGARRRRWLLLAEVYAAGEAPIVAADCARAGAGAPRHRQARAGVRRGHRGDAAADHCRGARRRRRPDHGRGIDRRRAGKAGQMAEVAARANCGATSRWRAMSRWRAGGAAARAYVPADLDDLAAFLAPRVTTSRCCSSASAPTCWCATAASTARWCSPTAR